MCGDSEVKEDQDWVMGDVVLAVMLVGKKQAGQVWSLPCHSHLPLARSLSRMRASHPMAGFSVVVNLPTEVNPWIRPNIEQAIWRRKARSERALRESICDVINIELSL